MRIHFGPTLCSQQYTWISDRKRRKKFGHVKKEIFSFQGRNVLWSGYTFAGCLLYSNFIWNFHVGGMKISTGFQMDLVILLQKVKHTERCKLFNQNTPPKCMSTSLKNMCSNALALQYKINMVKWASFWIPNGVS